jgi:glycosyltransferase involved in cell wall biosynthesis
MMRRFTAEEIRRHVSAVAFDEKILCSRDASWPKISIVTPSFNQGQFLERTILSVLNQNYPNLEYVVMDGGSTDHSVDIVKKYERFLACWKSEKDAGQGDALRRGFRLCTGGILAYLNSDDVYLPGVLQRVGSVFRDRPHTDVVYGNKYLTDEDDRIIGERRFTPYVSPICRLGFIYGGFGICQPASFWTKDLYDRAGEIDPSFIHCMDTDLFVRFAVHRARFQFVREYLAGGRIHRSSKTSTLRHIARQERYIIDERCRTRKSPFFAAFCTALVRATRIGAYLTQGDGVYLIKRKLVSDFKWVP